MESLSGIVSFSFIMFLEMGSWPYAQEPQINIGTETYFPTNSSKSSRT